MAQTSKYAIPYATGQTRIDQYPDTVAKPAAEKIDSELGKIRTEITDAEKRASGTSESFANAPVNRDGNADTHLWHLWLDQATADPKQAARRDYVDNAIDTATALLKTATNNDTPNTLVKRTSAGWANFNGLRCTDSLTYPNGEAVRVATTGYVNAGLAAAATPTAWKTLTVSDPLTADLPVKIMRVGALVWIQGTVSGPDTDLGATVAEIPEGYRPTHTVTRRDGNNISAVTAYAGGALDAAAIRLKADDQNVQIDLAALGPWPTTDPMPK